MKVNDEVIKSYFNKNVLSIYTEDEFKLIDMIKARDSKLADECESFLIHLYGKIKYRAFAIGFKQGVKYAKYKKSLHK